MLRRVNRLDLALMSRTGELRASPVDEGMKRLSRAANHSLLWLVVAGVLAVRKGVTRRAGLRGVAAIGGASFSASLIAKRLFPRRRPAADLLHVPRRLTRRPTSSSFPSGHAASASAFTTAVAMESPALATAIAPVAAAVAYSRVHTGVHWPSDVAAGAAIGVGAALLTRRWWPLGRTEPASAREHRALAALVDGEGLAVVVNPSAGLGAGDPTDEILREWPKATIVGIEDLDTVIADHAPQALGVAGGDGSVAAVAALAAARRLPLVLVPSGTLNHFARDVGVQGLDDAARAVADGDGALVDLAAVTVDGAGPRWFVNTASLGGYPDMVRLREQLQDRWGKWPAAAIALARVLRTSRPMRVELNGERRLVWMLFVGNGPYRPKGFAPTMRPALDAGLMDVRYIRADTRFSRARFFLGALLGSLHRSRTYGHLETRRLDVRLLDGAVAIATDGEVGPTGSTFEFRSRPAALAVYRPQG
ncbi:bifunctional phosphatase PAP2/diacylglycerol kinase family protein [Saccharothrix luteola]|uniref:bifunctional phosphatase PAP2/diacylglycerol kinase family protein n=1 Tax=Saccharothrix luteola TaxID=2893018 RepID=UPI001E4540A9|nr:bifunctional phosphatase PAP2/diacylglycerol kinase family protein [Saccharothrix luteola]MCC8243694.1 phosphatase PAP2 family protein [Saccharothrix luteola]